MNIPPASRNTGTLRFAQQSSIGDHNRDFGVPARDRIQNTFWRVRGGNGDPPVTSQCRNRCF
jgi:hypothetical protein